MQASAEIVLRGSFSNDNWATKISFVNDKATLSLREGQEIEFKLCNTDDNDKMFGNSGWMQWDNCSNWSFSSSENNSCHLRAAEGGTYTFILSGTVTEPKLSVEYPKSRTVYFCNNLSWEQPYAYILGTSYWDGNLGSGSNGRYWGIKMTRVEGSNIWKADFPSTISSDVIAFLKDEKNNADHFWQTQAVYREDFSTSKLLYVPNTGTSFSKNETTYYNEGEWHVYPTYTRPVTAGNFGTICLPFDATIEGAKVYEIASKVVNKDNGLLTAINLGEVTGTLEAGHAYIFKATGSTLTATYSGTYADATEADGMIGNLNSNDVRVPNGNYVVKDNMICQVGIGGSGVTCGQYRAYITLKDINEATSRSANFIGFDESTGIESVQAEKSENAIYNIHGQRVTDAQKGLVIVGGKKMLRK